MAADQVLNIVMKFKDQASAGMSSMTSRVDAMSSRMRSTGMAMSAAITVPLVAIATSGVRSFMELEKSMRNVQSVTGMTNAQTKELTRTFQQMSMDLSITTDTPINLANAYYNIVGAGFAAADAIEVLTVSTQSATAGLTDTETASRAITSVLNAYGQSAQQATNISDIMFTMVDRGVGSYSEFANALSNVTGTASAIGVSFNVVAAALSTMTKKGTDAATASTQLSGVMTQLLNPSTQLQEVISGLGYTSGFAMVNALGFAGTLDAIGGAVGNSPERLSQMFGDIRAVRGVFALAGANAQMFAQDLDAMNNVTGRTARAFATITESWASKAQNFQNTFTVFKQTIGEVLIPTLVVLMQAITPILKAFIGLPDGVKTTIVSILAFAAALGPVLFLLGNLIKFASGIKTVFLALKGLSAVTFLLSPMGLLLIALAAVAAAVYLIATNWDKVKEFAAKAWEAIKGFVAGIIKNIVDFAKFYVKLHIDIIKGVIKIASEFAKLVVNIGADLVRGLANMLASFAKMVLNFILNLAGGLIEFATSIPGRMVEIGWSIITGIAQGIESGVSFIIDVIESVINGMVGVIKNVLGIHSPSTVMMPIGAEMATGISEGFRSALIKEAAKISETVTNTFTGASTFSAGFGKAISDIVFDPRVLNMSGGGKVAYMHKIRDLLGVLTGASSWDTLRAEWGDDIRGLYEAMLALKPQFAQSGVEITEAFIQSIFATLGIASPSKVMLGVGKNMARGLDIGFSQTLNRNPLGAMVNNAVARISPSPLQLSAAGAGAGGGVNISIAQLTVPPGTTKQQVDEIAKELGKRLQRRGLTA